MIEVISFVILFILPRLFGFNDTVKIHVFLVSVILAFQSENARVADAVFYTSLTLFLRVL